MVVSCLCELYLDLALKVERAAKTLWKFFFAVQVAFETPSKFKSSVGYLLDLKEFSPLLLLLQVLKYYSFAPN